MIESFNVIYLNFILIDFIFINFIIEVFTFFIETQQSCYLFYFLMINIDFNNIVLFIIIIF